MIAILAHFRARARARAVFEWVKVDPYRDTTFQTASTSSGSIAKIPVVVLLQDQMVLLGNPVRAAA
jgi:hypothetical protein